MDEVADEAGMQRPNLYRYFANRDALITALIVREIELTNQARRERIAMVGPVSSILVEALALGHDIAVLNEMTQMLLVSEMRNTTSAIVTADQAIMTAECDYWMPMLAYGRSRAEINDGMSDQRIIHWFLAMQVTLSTRPELLDSLGGDSRTFFADFVVPPVLNPVRG